MIRQALRPVVVLALAASGLLAAACKEDPVRPPPASDQNVQPGGALGGGGGGDASANGVDAGGDGGGACTTLEADTAPAIDQIAVVGDPPAGSGGTLESGTYELSDARVYGSVGGGATGLFFRGRLALDVGASTTTIERVLVTSAQNGSATTERKAGTLVAGSTTATLAFTCEAPDQEQVTYTATGTTLVFTNTTTRESYTFTKR